MKATEMLTSAVLKMEENLVRVRATGASPLGVVNMAGETILEN